MTSAHKFDPTARWYLVSVYVKFEEFGPCHPTNFMASFDGPFLPGTFVEGLVDEFNVLSCTIMNWRRLTHDQTTNYGEIMERLQEWRRSKSNNAEPERKPWLSLVKEDVDE